jgi:chemotaxis protein CheC
VTEFPLLTPRERGLLVEMFNIGVDEAAASLSRLVKQRLTLSVLEVEFQSVSRLAQHFNEDCSMCSVSQHMSGPFDAQGMLLFTEQGSLEVVRRMLGSDMSDETLAELHQEALLEIGNIVLNACIGSISRIMETTFNIDPPQLKLGNARYLIPATAGATQDAALLIRISLELSDSATSGHIVFLLETVSLSQLHCLLQGALNRLAE